MNAPAAAAKITSKSPRAALIDALADDISCGSPAGKFDSSFFLDTLMDNQRVTADDVANLLSSDADIRMDTQRRIRLQVQVAAIEFFTTDARGTDYIDDKMAEARAEEDADAEYERKYGGCPDGDEHEDLLIKESRAA